MKLSLSQMEREKRPEPFELTLSDGKTAVTFVDPKRMRIAALNDLDTLPMMEQLEALTGEGFTALRDDPEMDAEALEWVMSQWRDHYGVGGPGEAPSSRG